MKRVLGRTIYKSVLAFIPMFVAAAWPEVGAGLQIAPVAAGVLLCTARALKGAWTVGWLAEI